MSNQNSNVATNTNNLKLLLGLAALGGCVSGVILSYVILARGKTNDSDNIINKGKNDLEKLIIPIPQSSNHNNNNHSITSHPPALDSGNNTATPTPKNESLPTPTSVSITTPNNNKINGDAEATSSPSPPKLMVSTSSRFFSPKSADAPSPAPTSDNNNNNSNELQTATTLLRFVGDIVHRAAREVTSGSSSPTSTSMSASIMSSIYNNHYNEHSQLPQNIPQNHPLAKITKAISDNIEIIMTKASAASFSTSTSLSPMMMMNGGNNIQSGQSQRKLSLAPQHNNNNHLDDSGSHLVKYEPLSGETDHQHQPDKAALPPSPQIIRIDEYKKSNNDNEESETTANVSPLLIKQSIDELRKQSNILLLDNISNNNKNMKCEESSSSSPSSSTSLNVYKYFSLAMRTVLRCSGEPMAVAQILAEALRGLLHADRCTVFVVDESQQCLVATIGGGDDPEEGKEQNKQQRISVKIGEGFAGRCAATRKPIIVNNAYEDEQFNANVDAVSGYITKTVLTVPLIFEGQLLAVVQLLNKLGGCGGGFGDKGDPTKNNKNKNDNNSIFTDADLDLFQTFTAVSGVVIRDALLRPEVRRLKISNTMMGEVCAGLVTANLHEQAEAASAVAEGLRRSTPGATSCTIVKVDFVKAALEEFEALQKQQERDAGRRLDADEEYDGDDDDEEEEEDESESGRGSIPSSSHESSPLSGSSAMRGGTAANSTFENKNNNNNGEKKNSSRSVSPLQIESTNQMGNSTRTRRPLQSTDNSFQGSLPVSNETSQVQQKQQNQQRRRRRSTVITRNAFGNRNPASSHNLHLAQQQQQQEDYNNTSFSQQQQSQKQQYNSNKITENSIQQVPNHEADDNNNGESSVNYEVIAQSFSNINNEDENNDQLQHEKSVLCARAIIDVLNGIIAGSVRPISGGKDINNKITNNNNKIENFVFAFPIVPFEDDLDGCWIAQVTIEASAQQQEKQNQEEEILEKNKNIQDSDITPSTIDDMRLLTNPKSTQVSSDFVLNSVEWLIPLSEAVARNSILLSSRDLQNEQFQRVGKILEKAASDHTRFTDPTKTLEYVAREIESICNWQSTVFFFEAKTTGAQEQLQMFPRYLPQLLVQQQQQQSEGVSHGSAVHSLGGSQQYQNNNNDYSSYAAEVSSLNGTATATTTSQQKNRSFGKCVSHSDMHLLAGTNNSSNNNTVTHPNNNNNNNSNISLGANLFSSATFSYFPGGGNHHNNSNHNHNIASPTAASAILIEGIEPVGLGDGVTGEGAASREPTYFKPGHVIQKQAVGEFGTLNYYKTNLHHHHQLRESQNNSSLGLLDGYPSSTNHVASSPLLQPRSTTPIQQFGFNNSRAGGTPLPHASGSSSPTSPPLHYQISETTSALVIPLMHKSVLLGAITILDPHPQLFAKYVPNAITGRVREQTPEQWVSQLEMFEFLMSIARFAFRAAGIVTEVVRQSKNSVSTYQLEDQMSTRKKSSSMAQNHNNNNSAKDVSSSSSHLYSRGTMMSDLMDGASSFSPPQHQNQQNKNNTNATTSRSTSLTSKRHSSGTREGKNSNDDNNNNNKKNNETESDSHDGSGALPQAARTVSDANNLDKPSADTTIGNKKNSKNNNKKSNSNANNNDNQQFLSVANNNNNDKNNQQGTFNLAPSTPFFESEGDDDEDTFHASRNNNSHVNKKNQKSPTTSKRKQSEVQNQQHQDDTVTTITVADDVVAIDKNKITPKSIQQCDVDQQYYELALNSNSFPIWNFHDGEQPVPALAKLLTHLFKNLDIDNDELEKENHDHDDKTSNLSSVSHKNKNKSKSISTLQLLGIDEARLLFTIGHALSRYQSVPYHNVFHAFDVTQSCYRLLRISGMIHILTPVEKFALLLSCVFHDIDHNGLNNNYHIKAETEIGMMGKLSGQRAVLELHHCQTAVRIINGSGLFAVVGKNNKTTKNKNNNNNANLMNCSTNTHEGGNSDDESSTLTSPTTSGIIPSSQLPHRNNKNNNTSQTENDDDDDDDDESNSNSNHCDEPTPQEKAENFKKITAILFSNILATDMASHKDIMTLIDDTLLDEDDSGSIFDPTVSEHRELSMKLLLKMADISNPAKEFSTGRRWGLAVTEEFFRQGDVERSEGREISPMCDREAKTDLSKSQIGFIQFVVKPYYSLCAKVFPPLAVIVESLNANLERWQKVAAAYSTSGQK